MDSTEKYSEIWQHYESKIGSFMPGMEKFCPDFLVISPAKTRSTWLYENLTSHKDILIEKKEINYLSVFWQWYDINWYLHLYSKGEFKCKGDISGTYSLLPVKAIQHIHTLFPNIKIILTIRHPVERTWSQIKHFFRFRVGPFKHFQGDLSTITLPQLLDKFWLDSYFLWSDYSSILKRWLSCFPPERIYVNFTDSFDQDAKRQLVNILDFLCVDSSIDFSNFPLKCKILEGLNIDMPDSIYTFFCSIFENSLKELEVLLHKNFHISLPPNWINQKKHKQISSYNVDIAPPLLPNRDVSLCSLPRLMESFNGYNILFYEGLFHALSHRSGEVDLHRLNSEQEKELRLSSDYFTDNSPQELKKLILKNHSEVK